LNENYENESFPSFLLLVCQRHDNFFFIKCFILVVTFIAWLSFFTLSYLVLAYLIFQQWYVLLVLVAEPTNVVRALLDQKSLMREK
jgi:hypothetical protein